MNRGMLFGSLVVAFVAGLALGYGAVRVQRFDSNAIRNARLEVGDKAPDFRLPDHTGGFVQLSDFQGHRDVVLAFYPLAWTPV